MPDCSYFFPTIKPVIFCKKSNGILRWQQSSMKWAPFFELSENKTPLFPIIPISIPQTFAKPHTNVSP